jgi:hypothetical protein
MDYHVTFQISRFSECFLAASDWTLVGLLTCVSSLMDF